MVSESEWCPKTRVGMLEGYRKATLGVEGWLPECVFKRLTPQRYPCVVPESDGCRKTRLGVLEGYRKASLGVKDGYGKPGLECRNICRRISLDRSVDIRNRLLHKYLRKFGQRCRKARLRVEMKVPENDVWSREKGFQIRQIQIPRLVGKQGLSRRNGTESGD